MAVGKLLGLAKSGLVLTEDFRHATAPVGAVPSPLCIHPMVMTC